MIRLRIALTRWRISRLTRRSNRLIARTDADLTSNWGHKLRLDGFNKIESPGPFLRFRIWLLKRYLTRRGFRYIRALKRLYRINTRLRRATNNFRRLSARLKSRKTATTFMAWLKATSNPPSRKIC